MPESTFVGISPRISLRAVVAGTLVALALLWVLMVVAGALGLWRLGVVDAATLGAGLAIWAGLSWPLAVLAGAYTSSTLSGASSSRDGALHGLVTWAGTCVTGGVLGCVWFMSALNHGIVDLETVRGLDSSAVLWATFVSEVLAISASVVGGRAGVAVPGAGERAHRGFREPTPTAP